MQLVIPKNNGLNVNLAYFLDADLKINSFPNVQNYLKIKRNELILNCRNNLITVIMIMTKSYMDLWHKCLLITKFLLEILVTVRNWLIGFYIEEQHFIWHHRFRIFPQDHYNIQINILKLRMDITSWQRKKDKFK